MHDDIFESIHNDDLHPIGKQFGITVYRVAPSAMAKRNLDFLKENIARSKAREKRFVKMTNSAMMSVGNLEGFNGGTDFRRENTEASG